MKPIISIVIPAYNEKRHIKACLDSIFGQSYPHRLLDVIIVDNKSTDDTVAIAKKYPVRVYTDTTKDAQRLKMIGLQKARGEYFIFLDADNRLVGRDWFARMLKPHEDKRIVGSFTDIVPDPDDPSLSQYFASFSFYSSPLFQFLSTPLDKTIKTRKNGYFLCHYEKGKIPPTGSCLYKMRCLKKAGILKQRKFMELDVLVYLVEKGYKLYAYVSETGMYHTHIIKLSTIITKRKRNIDRNYLKDVSTRKFTWMRFGSMQDVLKLLFWIVYSLTIIGPTVHGVIKTVRYRRIYFSYYEPVVTFLETIAVIYAVLRSGYRVKFFSKMFG